jgi:hypothetical protein
MTELQIKYQQLELDRDRVAKELELNERQVTEVERHNKVTEEQSAEQLKVNWHQAESARMNAETNRLNYGVNLMNARTNQRNAAVNERNAAVNERNAAVNEGNLRLAQQMQPYRIAEAKAQTEYVRAQTADVNAKLDSGYWDSVAWSNYNSKIGSALIGAGGSLVSQALRMIPSIGGSPTTSGGGHYSASNSRSPVSQQYQDPQYWYSSKGGTYDNISPYYSEETALVPASKVDEIQQAANKAQDTANEAAAAAAKASALSGGGATWAPVTFGGMYMYDVVAIPGHSALQDYVHYKATGEHFGDVTGELRSDEVSTGQAMQDLAKDVWTLWSEWQIANSKRKEAAGELYD